MGSEYFISRNLAVNFNVRMGPSIFPNDYYIRYRGNQARFTMEALFGLAYKF